MKKGRKPSNIENSDLPLVLDIADKLTKEDLHCIMNMALHLYWIKDRGFKRYLAMKKALLTKNE